ncbi:MAG: carboxypeptidase-like regulatory domain-containing protein, partial [Pseudomonadales bacterium]
MSLLSADIAPVGIVFDDATGAPLDGVIVTLIDADSGTPADVRGDGPDYALFPSAVKSGEASRDQFGNRYEVGAGEYRFPAIPAGNYRLEIFNTAGKRLSVKSDDELQALDEAAGRALVRTSEGNYTLTAASRGEVFSVPQGSLPRIDIPIETMARSGPSSASSIEFLQYSRDPAVGSSVNVQQTQCVADQTRQVSELDDTTIPVPGIVNLVATRVIKVGQPVFVRVTDADQNQDPDVRERITIQLDVAASGDREYLDLTETEPDSGVFVGYIQSTEGESVTASCVLGVVKDQPIVTTYTDAYDNSDTAQSMVLVDPFGVVFDTSDGSPIDGVTITLIDLATGQPAEVFGDGPAFAAYPNRLVTGGNVTDAAGVEYDFPTGEYRFPFVAAGFYRLEVTDVPEGYLFPSTATEASLQLLPGAPYEVVEGSRGDEFEVPVGPALKVDIPIDPVNAALFLRKSASRSTAAIGEFVQYKVAVETIEGAGPGNIIIEDILPVG